MDETDLEDDYTSRSNPWFVPRPGPTDVDYRHYGHSPRPSSTGAIDTPGCANGSPHNTGWLGN
eukprot:1196032-Rhodomonas_salina.3